MRELRISLFSADTDDAEEHAMLGIGLQMFGMSTAAPYPGIVLRYFQGLHMLGGSEACASPGITTNQQHLLDFMHAVNPICYEVCMLQGW